jgi:hypothetical protein
LCSNISVIKKSRGKFTVLIRYVPVLPLKFNLILCIFKIFNEHLFGHNRSFFRQTGNPLCITLRFQSIFLSSLSNKPIITNYFLLKFYSYQLCRMRKILFFLIFRSKRYQSKVLAICCNWPFPAEKAENTLPDFLPRNLVSTSKFHAENNMMGKDRT